MISLNRFDREHQYLYNYILMNLRNRSVERPASFAHGFWSGSRQCPFRHRDWEQKAIPDQEPWSSRHPEKSPSSEK